MKFYLLVLLLSFAACQSKKDQKGNDPGKNIPDTNSLVTNDTTVATAKIDIEKFGDLRIGQSSTDVLQILGKPSAQSKPVLWEADGLMHETWDYKEKGLAINMSSEGTNAASIFSITANAPCSYKTAANMGIGNTYDEIMNAYKRHIDAEATDENMIPVGSVYGGILFTFKDKKAVTVFLGAAAE